MMNLCNHHTSLCSQIIFTMSWFHQLLKNFIRHFHPHINIDQYDLKCFGCFIIRSRKLSYRHLENHRNINKIHTRYFPHWWKDTSKSNHQQMKMKISPNPNVPSFCIKVSETWLLKKIRLNLTLCPLNILKQLFGSYTKKKKSSQQNILQPSVSILKFELQADKCTCSIHFVQG